MKEMNPTEKSLSRSINNFKDDFPALKETRDGKPPVYLDNACTTLVPYQVINTMDEYYKRFPACGGRRSHHWFAREVSRHIEGDEESGASGVRQQIADFIHAESSEQIVFTLNTTHAINIVALGFPFNPGDVVLLTDREHNSNLLPWLRLQQMGMIRVERVGFDEEERFDLDAYEKHFKNQHIRLVSLAFTSNVTGVSLPAEEIIRIAHRNGARVLLDGAQTVPHQKVDVQALGVDFLAFSLHKMCGPRGVGVLYARSGLLGKGSPESLKDAIEPVFLGGGTAADSSYDRFTLLNGFERFEAGIQNYPGILGAGATIQYLNQIGLDQIREHETALNQYLSGKLLERYGELGWFTIIGPQAFEQRGGILSFEVHRPNAVGIASELDARNNIMIRDGVFCVHSYFNDRFGPNWIHPKTYHDHRMIYRVSFYLYNTFQECDVFAETLDRIFTERSYL